jgi:catechol 2,3-dioxygenase-like lactoylglutathione lyase family enzyme
MSVSQKWYQDYLGFSVMKFEEWGDFPIFMISGDFSVALFPAQLNDPEIPKAGHVQIDHFALRVSGDDFQAAQEFFKTEGISYHYEDHHYFKSIYLHDPDGHKIELTCTTGFLIK